MTVTGETREDLRVRRSADDLQVEVAPDAAEI